MGLSNKLSCETGSFSYCHKPHRFLQPEVFEAFFFCAGTLGCTVCLAPQLFLLGCPHVNVGLTRPPAGPLPCCVSSVPWLSVSAPPTPLDECFFFNSLVIGLLYSSVFWQFWLFFCFLNLLLSFFLLFKEAKCIYLCLHLGWNSLK